MLLPSLFGNDFFEDVNGLMNWPDDKDFFSSSPFYGKNARNLMRTDVRETKDSYQMEVDLPGFSKEDLDISLEKGYLTVSAEKKDDRSEKDSKGNYIRRERYTGSCSRTFFVGEDIKEEDISAHFENGILNLSVKKAVPEVEEEKAKKISIEG